MPNRKMVDNLGMRQRALNERVQEAFLNNVKLEDIKETSQVNKLFKIDLAAKCKHEGFILEVLKSADSVYTVRALKKCLWLFDDDHTHIINPEFLHNEIFSFTSLKMKRKILSHVALHVKDESLAASFYEYCVQSKLIASALKFMVLTSESFKLALLTGQTGPIDLIVKKGTKYLLKFLKSSFSLFTALLERIKDFQKRRELLKYVQHWYKHDSNKYLDLVEKYDRYPFNKRYSSMIMKKHKDRVLTYPRFYINYLIDRDILIKRSSIEDIKSYIIGFLPKGDDFWSHDYTLTMKFLKLIPHEETYNFLKKICLDRYSNNKFEKDVRFYTEELYRFMTKEQQEEWALDHIKSDKQILGEGRDYLWYGFVNFKDAFEAMKKFISSTKDIDKRNEMLRTLIMSAKTNNELEILFSYFQNKHLNEPRHFKGRFLNEVVKEHNVFEFDDTCWKSFHTLLLSMDIYNTKDYTDHYNGEFRTVVFLYNIVNKQEIPDLLMQYPLDDFRFNIINSHMNKLSDSKRRILYEYLHSTYINKIFPSPQTREDETRIRNYFDKLEQLMQIRHEKEPPPVTKFVKKRQPKKRSEMNRSLLERELMRRLKEDSESVIEALPEVEKQFETYPFKIDKFLKKINLYYPDKISKSYLELFGSIISKDSSQASIDAAVNGIFQLGDDDYKIKLMIDYAPAIDNKVDLSDVDHRKIRIQKAICRYFPRSRPPVPLANTIMYLKGDCVQNCHHIFNVFLANLSLPSCLNFIEATLDTPVLVQKHGIRLAFECFDITNLKNLIMGIWSKHKDISLRAVIYKALFKKVQIDINVELFEVLKKFTTELNADDKDKIFKLLKRESLADEFLGDFIESAWNAVDKFKDKGPNIQRKKTLVERIQNGLPLMQEVFVKDLVLKIIDELFKENKIKILFTSDVLNEVYEAKWSLVKAFLIHSSSNSKTPLAYVHLTTHLTQMCIESWNDIHEGELIYQRLCFDFIRGLREESLIQRNCNPIDSVPIFEAILNEFKLKLPLPEVYIEYWRLNLTIIYNKVKQDRPNSKDICIQYAREVGRFVIQVVKEGNYLSHMARDLSYEISCYLEDLDFCMSTSSCLVKFASGLTDHESVETYVLAAFILPSGEYSCYDWDKFKAVVSKLSQMKDPSVQCAMHLKLRLKYVIPRFRTFS